MHDFLILNGRKISIADIKNGKIGGNSEFEKATIGFCHQWLNEQTSFNLKTSGSTGTPKTISVSRQQMLASARQTIDFFKVSSSDTVLVCLNTAYVAGIMMLVRGLESGAKIILTEPSSNPLLGIEEPIDFIAIVPLQLDSILEEPTSMLQLESIRATIVGGAPVSFGLLKKLASTKASVWATFGMTETLTHFALRQINPVEQTSFQVLGDTKIKLDERGCLIIKSPVTNNKEITSNDLAELTGSNQFMWIGRTDNTINSGGIKLQIEELEKKTAILLTDLEIEDNYIIAPIPDSQLHQKVCLIIESENNYNSIEEANLLSYFDKYELPKRVVYLPRFIYTPTGKINRSATIQLIDLLT